MNLEARGAVNREGLMTFFISLIFWAEVKIVTTDNNSSIHGSALYNATKQMATNANISSEGALLINIMTNNGFAGGFESKTN